MTEYQRFDDVDVKTRVEFALLPQSTVFGRGYSVQCVGEPLKIQTPHMRLPHGCSDGDGRIDEQRLRIVLPLLVDDANFLGWYEGLEAHIIDVAESKCIDWFGLPAIDVKPSLRDSFFSCIANDDLSPDLLLTLNAKVRGKEIQTAFFDSENVPCSHRELGKNTVVACCLELEGIWFANHRWGLRWLLNAVKSYGTATTGQASAESSGFAFLSDDDDDKDDNF